MKEKNEKEILRSVAPGWGKLVLAIVLYAAAAALFVASGVLNASYGNTMTGVLIAAGSVITVIAILVCCGFFMLSPNQACVFRLFGDYKGTVKNSGLMWINPFYTKKKISLRSRNLNGQKIKVNDQIGNPIEIAAVVVWKVSDTYKACFEVENYDSFVNVQSESAVRHLANMYPYDFTEKEGGISLRGNTEEVSETLRKELMERVEKAGVVIEEARISHLAYAPEIAAAMLQRQQASAVIAARQMIVEGAVGMVEMAIERLSAKGVVPLDDDKKAAMVSNLMVVLCSEKSASPVVNAGTLYQG